MSPEAHGILRCCRQLAELCHGHRSTIRRGTVQTIKNDFAGLQGIRLRPAAEDKTEQLLETVKTGRRTLRLAVDAIALQAFEQPRLCRLEPLVVARPAVFDIADLVVEGTIVPFPGRPFVESDGRKLADTFPHEFEIVITLGLVKRSHSQCA